MGQWERGKVNLSHTPELEIYRLRERKKKKDIKMNEVIKMKYPKCEADKSKQVFCKSVKLPAQ